MSSIQFLFHGVQKIVLTIWTFLKKWCWTSNCGNGSPVSQKRSVAIVGAGISGIIAAIKVKKELGITPQIFEESSDVGGVWFTHKYPNAATDAPAPLYSISFEPNPNWTEFYSSQPEILDYLTGVASKHSLYDHTLFNTKVKRISWVARESKWKMDYTTKGKLGQTAYFDIIITATSNFNNFLIPEKFKGFQGKLMHSRNFDVEIDLRGKTVGVVGNGASAAQIIPHVQKNCGKLISYQRSPVWVVPKPQFKYSGWFMTLCASIPGLMWFQRLLVFAMHEPWYPLLLRNADGIVLKYAQQWLVKYMKKCLEEEGRTDLVKILIPKYTFFCKAIVMGSRYLKSLCEKNVKVRMGSIVDIQGKTIRHSDGSADVVDIMVLATGYEFRKNLLNFQVVGRDGLNLNEKWDKDYPETFQSIHVHGCPNLFFIMGPNSFPVNSKPIAAEVQVASIMRSIKYIISKDLLAMEVKEEPQKEWTTKLRSELKDNTAFVQSCTSSLKNEDGDIFFVYPSSLSNYWWVTRWSNYAKNFIVYTKQK